jgi:plastocyanin
MIRLRNRALDVWIAVSLGLAIVGCPIRSSSVGAMGAPAPGTIRGKVDLPPAPARVVERRPSVSQLGGGGRVDLLDPTTPPATSTRKREVPPEPAVSVVYLERAPRGAFAELEERHARMDQRGERFVPHVLAITVGSVVDFPNNDQTYHNVFSLSDTRTFDLGRYAAGHSKAIRFERPGIVRVFCDIHSHMNAFILVFAHRYFSVTDAEGHYHIDNVPPGSYTVVMWNEVWPQESRPVTVPESGGDVDVSFAPTRASAGHAAP